MNIDELKENLAQVTSKIRSLTDEKSQLEKDLQKAEDDLYLNVFNDWKIDNNTNMIWIDKTRSGYYLIKTIKVINIDLERQYFRAIIGDYFSEYFEGHFSCKIDWISFSSLIPAESCYNIYFVTSGTLSFLQESLCNVEVTRNNLSEVDSALDKVCERSIKKQVD